jgi:tRNA(adenine34) deaminase
MPYPIFSDEFFMNEALKEARLAFQKDEVPVGAVIVCKNQIIARSHNLTEELNDVTAHAEMMAITAAESYLGSKYLNECTLYVTLEPCVMCASAASWAKIGNIVYGAEDSKAGFSLIGSGIIHPKTVLKKGVLHEECSSLLKTFFSGKRQ